MTFSVLAPQTNRTLLQIDLRSSTWTSLLILRTESLILCTIFFGITRDALFLKQHEHRATRTSLIVGQTPVQQNLSYTYIFLDILWYWHFTLWEWADYLTAVTMPISNIAVGASGIVTMICQEVSSKERAVWSTKVITIISGTYCDNDKWWFKNKRTSPSFFTASSFLSLHWVSTNTAMKKYLLFLNML